MLVTTVGLRVGLLLFAAVALALPTSAYIFMLRSDAWYAAFANDLDRNLPVGTDQVAIESYLASRAVPFSYDALDRTLRTSVANPQSGWFAAEEIRVKIMLDEQMRLRGLEITRTPEAL